MEVVALRLVEGCVVSRYNHPAQGDYSRSAKIRNSCLMFFSECFREVINSIAETDATKLGVTLQNYDVKYLLLNSGGSWLTISTRVIKKKCNKFSLFTEWFQNYTKMIIHLRLNEYCWIILLTSSWGFSNNIHLASSKQFLNM